MSARTKTLLFLGILIILAALIAGTYNDLMINAASQSKSEAPLYTPRVATSVYPAGNNAGSNGTIFQAYPYPPPKQGEYQLNLAPGLSRIPN